MAASANNTLVALGSKAAVTDAKGNRWTITSGGQVALNGAADPTTRNVILLAYEGGVIWQENTSKLWWSKTSPTDAWGPDGGTPTSPVPASTPAQVAASPNDTVVLAGSAAAVVDAHGNRWTITASGQVAVNGVTDQTTRAVTELAYEGGKVWQENASKLWWSKTLPSDTWGPAGGTPTSPVPAAASGASASPDNTLVPLGSLAAIVDGSANKWTITSGGQVAVNGATDGTTANVIELAYEKGVVWQENASKLWWSKTSPTAAWGPSAGTATSPVPGATTTGATTTGGAVTAPAAPSGAVNDVGGTSGRGGYLLPSGYLSTSGSQFVDSHGNPVRIASIGWNGTDSLAFAPAGLQYASYQSIIDSIKADGFNTIRIPWTDVLMHAAPAAGSIDYSQNPGLQGLNSLQVLDAIVNYAGQDGLKIILDHHNNEGNPALGGGTQGNGLWYDLGAGSDNTDGYAGAGTPGTVTSAQFTANWVALANRYAGNSTVIGMDLTNEPAAYGGESTWGDGSPTDIRAMFQNTGNAILAVNPNLLIIAEPPSNFQQTFTGVSGQGAIYGDYSKVFSDPVKLNVANKLVYSSHLYPQEIGGASADSGAAAISLWNAGWGSVVTSGLAPVFIGEMGASMTPGDADAAAWASTLMSYMSGQDGAQGGPSITGNQQAVSGSWWLAGNENGQSPNGIQTAWGAGNYRPEQQAITDKLLYAPSHVSVV